MEVPEIPFLHDLSPSTSALSDSDNRRVSSFVPSTLRPNPRFARTSDTRQTLGVIGRCGLNKNKKRGVKL